MTARIPSSPNFHESQFSEAQIPISPDSQEPQFLEFPCYSIKSYFAFKYVGCLDSLEW